MANNDYFKTGLSGYVDHLNNLANSLYDDKKNVNEVEDALLSTHVTAQDLNIIKLGLSTLFDNVSAINSHLINYQELQEYGSNDGGDITNSLNKYLATEYIRKNQLIIDGDAVNDSVLNLDEVYLRHKNIFVDGYKISYSSPYNLVSYSQLNLTISGLLAGLYPKIDEYLIGKNLSYGNGRFIDVNQEDRVINCTLSGSDYIDVNVNTKKISIKPSQTANQVLSTNASNQIVWATIPPAQTGSSYDEGIYIHIDDESKINCTLTAGDNVDIAEEADENGKYPISVKDGTIENKGVVQLVDIINEDNQERIDLAVTPFALMGFLGIEEHIIEDIVSNTLTSPESVSGKVESTINGWIRLSSMRSSKYPGYCLAIAWGQTELIYGKEGDMIFSLMNEGYCKFYRIIYPMFHVIPVAAPKNTDARNFSFEPTKTSSSSATIEKYADISVQLKKYIAEPGEQEIIEEVIDPLTGDVVIDETTGEAQTITSIVPDAEVITHILAFVQSMSDHNRAFYLKWFVLGYINANVDEVWGPDIPYIKITCALDVKQKYGWAAANNYSNYFDTGADVAIPTTWKAGYAQKGEKSKPSVTVKWKLNRVKNEYDNIKSGYYQLDGVLKACVNGVKTAQAWLYVDFSNARIDFRPDANGKAHVKNVKIYRSWYCNNGVKKNSCVWTKKPVVTEFTFDPKSKKEQTIYSCTATVEPDSNVAYTKFTITVGKFATTFKIQALAWYQHGASQAYVRNSQEKNRNTNEDLVTVTFVEGALP